MRNYSERNLIRHEAETWCFLPDGRLRLVFENDSIITEARWVMKGRGHILKIIYDAETFELYDIKELTKNEMVLNYDIGMEVRGIAKLKFEKQ